MNKLVNTIKVVELTDDNLIDRELLLVKVCAKDEDRSELLRIAEIFNANLVDVSKKTIPLKLWVVRIKSHLIIELLRPLGIKEMARSGVVAIAKENKLLENCFNIKR